MEGRRIEAKTRDLPRRDDAAVQGGRHDQAGPTQLRPGHLIPLPLLKKPAADLRGTSTPLLEEEEEGDARPLALIPERFDAHAPHRPVAVPGLPAGDQPVNPGQIQPGKRPEKRLGADEANRGGDLSQEVSAVDVAAFSIDTPAQTFCGQGRYGASSTRRSCRWVGTWNWCDDASTMTSKIRRTCATGIRSWKTSDIELTKIRRGSFYPEGQLKALWTESEIEALLVRVARDAAEALGKRLRVAVSLPGRDLVASRNRIPARVGPLDVAAVAHRIAARANARSSLQPGSTVISRSRGR